MRRGTRRLVAGFMGLVLVMFAWCGGQPRWGPFGGQVVDVTTNTPIAGAHVMAVWYRTIPSGFYHGTEAITDRDGRFKIPHLWRRWAWTREPIFEFFAPGYVIEGFDVAPPDGRYLIDPTIVRMRPLKTREERCKGRMGLLSPLHGEAPLFHEALRADDRELRCNELREHSR